MSVTLAQSRRKHDARLVFDDISWSTHPAARARATGCVVTMSHRAFERGGSWDVYPADMRLIHTRRDPCASMRARSGAEWVLRWMVRGWKRGQRREGAATARESVKMIIGYLRVVSRLLGWA